MADILAWRLCRRKFAGGSPAAGYLSCLAKKGNPKKAPPVCRRCAVPCVARPVRRLRNSRCALRQSSPTSPDRPPLLGGAQGIKKQKRSILGGLIAHRVLMRSVRCAHAISDSLRLKFLPICSHRKAPKPAYLLRSIVVKWSFFGYLCSH